MVPHLRLDMTDTNKIQPNLSFGGSPSIYVVRFLLAFENVAMRDKMEDQKALQILFHLDGASFDFYYSAFARNGSPTE